MNAVLAIFSLTMLLIVSLIQFANELYYRRRVSALGVIIFVCTLYLMWYLRYLDTNMVDLATGLSKYPPATIKGE